MRRVPILFSAAALGLAIFGSVSSSSAGVAVYYINAEIDSSWLSGSAGPFYPTAFPISSTYGSVANPGFLTDTWSFVNQNSVIDAQDDSQGLVLGSDYAKGQGTVSSVVNGDGFTASGMARGDTMWEAANGNSDIEATGVSAFTMNFRVPADQDYLFTLNGSTAEDHFATVLFRVSSNASVSPLVELTLSGTLVNQEFTLPAGSLCVIDLFASTNGQAYSNALYPGAFGVESSYNLSGTFTAIPEPAIAGVLATTAIAALARRRRATAQRVC